jgi:hypothetical protein
MLTQRAVDGEGGAPWRLLLVEEMSSLTARRYRAPGASDVAFTMVGCFRAEREDQKPEQDQQVTER